MAKFNTARIAAFGFGVMAVATVWSLAKESLKAARQESVIACSQKIDPSIYLVNWDKDRITLTYSSWSGYAYLTAPLKSGEGQKAVGYQEQQTNPGIPSAGIGASYEPVRRWDLSPEETERTFSPIRRCIAPS